MYILAPHQIEVSGFIPEDSPGNCPYPEARSREARFWRCGPRRAKFIAESVWTVKKYLEALGSGLVIRIGHYGEEIRRVAQQLQGQGLGVGAVWMTAEEGTEEKEDEKKVMEVCEEIGAEVRFWTDEKFFIDDRDLSLSSPQDLPDVFTTYRKSMEPLRSKPRPMIPAPAVSSLPSFFPSLPPLESPFAVPDTEDEFVEAMVRPVRAFLPQLTQPKGQSSVPFSGDDQEKCEEVEAPALPTGTVNAHPFLGGEGNAHARLRETIHSGIAPLYKSTRNGLLGVDFSMKISAYLAHGCLTARQVHWALMDYELGEWNWNKWGQKTGLLPFHGATGQEWESMGAAGGKEVPSGPRDVRTPDDVSKLEGYGEGENEGTAAVRFELLWRDYMRLCGRKFGARLFALNGFRQEKKVIWKKISLPRRQPNPRKVAEAASNSSASMGGQAQIVNGSRYTPTRKVSPKMIHRGSPSLQPTVHVLKRCLHGTTGQSLIDATARELLTTGYTSNRARQNFASFLTKHLGIDWRLGAEWYECCLIDYDVNSNWANWQYVAGVGNDPRGESRIFNPVKQGFDYDPQGTYVKAWVPELRSLFQTEREQARTETGGTGDEGAAADKTQQPIKGLENILQPCTTSRDEWAQLGWEDMSWEKKEMWERPVLHIDFMVEGKPGLSGRAFKKRGFSRAEGGGPGGGRRGFSSGRAGYGGGGHGYSISGYWNNRSGSGGVHSSGNGSSGESGPDGYGGCGRGGGGRRWHQRFQGPPTQPGRWVWNGGPKAGMAPGNYPREGTGRGAEYNMAAMMGGCYYGGVSFISGPSAYGMYPANNGDICQNGGYVGNFPQYGMQWY